MHLLLVPLTLEIAHYEWLILNSFALQLLSAVNCWLKCMMLDPYNQTDHPDCKSRPDSGLSAITELDPGYITGMLAEYSSYSCCMFDK